MPSIVKNTFVYTLGNIIPAAASFILLPIYTLYLSPSDYGILESVNALSPILAILFSLCFGASIFRLYYDYKTESQRKLFFGTIFISTIVFSLVFLILIIIFRNKVEQIYKTIEFNPYYLFLIITVFISNFFDLPQKYLMLKGKPVPYIILTISKFIVTASLILFFIINRLEGPAGYLKARLISSLIFLPIYLIISIKIIKFKFSFEIFKSLLRFSIPIIPILLSSWVLNLSDRIFIERYFSIHDVGIYSLSYKIASLVLILVSAFNMAYRPFFFQHSNDSNTLRGKEIIYRHNNLFLILMIIAIFLISFFAKEIVTLFFSANYIDAYHYIPLIVFSYLLAVLGGFTGRFFEQSKKMKQNMFISIGMAFSNISLNFLLIPYWGAYGAIFATALSLLGGFIVAYFYTKKYCYFVDFNWSLIFSLTTSLAFIVIIFQLFIDFQNVYISLIIKLIITGLSCMFILRKRTKEIKQFLSSGELFSNE